MDGMNRGRVRLLCQEARALNESKEEKNLRGIKVFLPRSVHGGFARHQPV